eukprot:623325-Rhodomonas_salina.1
MMMNGGRPEQVPPVPPSAVDHAPPSSETASPSAGDSPPSPGSCSALDLRVPSLGVQKPPKVKSRDFKSRLNVKPKLPTSLHRRTTIENGNKQGLYRLYRGRIGAPCQTCMLAASAERLDLGPELLLAFLRELQRRVRSLQPIAELQDDLRGLRQRPRH